MPTPDLTEGDWRTVADHALAPPPAAATPTRDDWRTGWPDLLAFGLGLAVAWLGGWRAGDLVWSLWLSSLVVGYSIIVWSVGRPALEMTHAAWHDWSFAHAALREAGLRKILALGAMAVVGAVIVLGFFTFHFGFFHYVHSQFLIAYFPLVDANGTVERAAGLHTYEEVFRRYWQFLPAAFLAHRAAFLARPPILTRDVSMTADAIAKRKAANAEMNGTMEPYKNVFKMHILILFFGFVHFAGLDNFAVYAVVYALYFFPWRLVLGPSAQLTVA